MVVYNINSGKHGIFTSGKFAGKDTTSARAEPGCGKNKRPRGLAALGTKRLARCRYFDGGVAGFVVGTERGAGLMPPLLGAAAPAGAALYASTIAFVMSSGAE